VTAVEFEVGDPHQVLGGALDRVARPRHPPGRPPGVDLLAQPHQPQQQLAALCHAGLERGRLADHRGVGQRAEPAHRLRHRRVARLLGVRREHHQAAARRSAGRRERRGGRRHRRDRPLGVDRAARDQPVALDHPRVRLDAPTFPRRHRVEVGGVQQGGTVRRASDGDANRRVVTLDVETEGTGPLLEHLRRLAFLSRRAGRAHQLEQQGDGVDRLGAHPRVPSHHSCAWYSAASRDATIIVPQP
jgi:hypothetical protein